MAKNKIVENNRIKFLRVKHKMTQQDLGKVINLGFGAIGSYERGDTEPSLKDIVKLADFFEVSTDYLLKRTDIKERPDIIANASSRGITLMEGFYTLPDEAQNKIEELLKMAISYYKKDDTGMQNE